MQVYEGSRGYAGAARGCVLTVGNFDGLHRGHQALLAAVLERARSLGAPAVLYTFDPHPRRVLQPERDQPRLMTWDQLVDGLAEAGLDAVIREPFTREFAALSADAFLTDVIAERVAPREIFVGRDFHFGRGRGGSGEMLAQRAPTFGMRVTIIAQVRAEGLDVSSTRIRDALAAGDVDDARACLGRDYAVRGRIVKGDQRGRTLGFPTANLEPENELIPARGVYATRIVRLDSEGPRTPLPAVTNVGTRPTFDAGRLLAETHVLDFDSDLYGERVELRFGTRLRDEQRFPDIDALKRAIADDAERARAWLSKSPA